MTGCSNKLRLLTGATLLLMMVLTPGAVEARELHRGYVLPPISTEKMRELLAPGPGKLPGGYRFVGARIEKVAILARYRSAAGGGQITVMLGNPSQTTGRPHTTRKFALLLHGRQSERAPLGPGLVKALAAHIRTKEASWRWVRVTLKSTEVRKLHRKYKLNMKPSYSREWYGVFLLLLLLLGPLASWWYQRSRGARGPPERTASRPARGWDRFDLGALGIVALFVASVIWPMLAFPITGDEATNLELNFWSHWLFGHESSAHPPLFRVLIHLTARDIEPLWLLRGPVTLFAAVTLWLFWRLARARTNAWIALALTATLAVSGIHWQFAFQQKSLWLWLLLLLAAHGSFERALAGERRRWAHYVVWSTLAVLTHYLSVAYLAGHLLHVVLRRRKELVSHVLALAPAALAVLPLSLALMQGDVGRLSGYDPAKSFVGQLIANSVVGTGLAVLLLATPAVLLGPRDDTDDPGILPLVGVGFAVTLALSSQMVLWSRYFFPVLPFGLLWVAGRLRLRSDRLINVQIGALILAAVVHLTASQYTIRQMVHAGRATTLYAAYRRAAPHETGQSRPDVVLIHPGWRFPMVYYQLTRRRHLWATGCPGQRSPNYHNRGPELLVAVSPDAHAARLDRLLADLGQVDVLLYTIRDGSTSREVIRWVRAHCQPLVNHRSKGRAETGTAFRCRARQPARSNVCKAVKRFDKR